MTPGGLGAGGAGTGGAGAGGAAGAGAGAAGASGAAGAAGAAAAGAAGATGAASAAGASGLLGWVAANAGILGYVATAAVSTSIIGGSVMGLSQSPLAAQSLNTVKNIVGFDFQPAGLVTRLEDGYSAHTAAQALAVREGGVALPLLPVSEVVKVRNVSQNIIAQAQQDKASLAKQSANNDKLAGFKTSDDAKAVLDPPKPKLPNGASTPPPASDQPAIVNTSTAGQLVALVPLTSTPTHTPTPAGTLTPTQTPTQTSTSSPTPAISATSTISATFTPTPTQTFTPSPSATDTPSATPTDTATPTPTSTFTPTPTNTFTSTPTNTFTPTPTDTFTPTPTDTFTPTPTDTFTPTPTNTFTPTATSTAQPVVIASPGNGFALMTLSGMIPGDSISRQFSVQVQNASSFSYSLGTTCSAGCTSPLWTDSSAGLQLTLLRNGTVLYGPAPIKVSTPVTVGNVNGQSDTIAVRVSLPSSASNALAGQTLTISFNWVVTTP